MELIRYVYAKNKIKFENGVFSIKINDNNFESEKNSVTKEQLEKSIERFANTMVKKCKYFDINNFMNKISTTYFICKRKPFKSDEEDDNSIIVDGNYSSDDDTLRYCNTTTLFHELLHLSVQKHKKGKIDRGGLAFNIDGTDYNIGTGIDEGVTELLRTRYFYKKNNESYSFEVTIAKLIEKLIGKDTLEKCYFEAEYANLLVELSKYSYPEEALQFLEAIDRFTDSSIVDLKNVDKDSYIDGKKTLEYISRYLFNAFCTKIRNENLSNNDIYRLFSPDMWLMYGYVSCENESGKNILQEINFVSCKKYKKYLGEAKGINQ